MNFNALDRGELVASIGGILLGISLFVSWYTLGNRNALVGTCHGPNTTCTGWNALAILRYLLLIAAVAPADPGLDHRPGHALSWPRGELTAVTALLALTMIVFRGVIDKPGSPPGGDQDHHRLVAGAGGRLPDPGRLGVASPGERRAAQTAGVL